MLLLFYINYLGHIKFLAAQTQALKGPQKRGPQKRSSKIL